MSLRPSADPAWTRSVLSSFVLLSWLYARELRAEQPPLAPAPDAQAATSDSGTQESDAGVQIEAGSSVPPAPATTPPSVPLSPAARRGLELGASNDNGDAPVGMQTSEGPTDLRYLLERVEVVGNHSTKPHMVRAFVPLEIGSAFKVNDPEIEALRYRLLGTGWYDKVELRLKRGKRPGWVVLMIEVEERRTLVFQQLAAGVGWSVEGVQATDGSSASSSRKPEPYLGLALADTNFLGTGKTLGGEVLLSLDQQGIALAYNDPVVRSSNWAFHTRLSFVNGQEYFGGDKNVQSAHDCSEETEANPCIETPRLAVVDYWRTGLTVGTARDVGSFTRFSLDWRGDYVYVPSGGLPAAAIEQRGRGPVSAIDFAIEPLSSFVSMLTVGFTYDKRDSAILPSRGTLASFLGDLASPLIGSDYQFVRLQASLNQWFPLRWAHTIRLGVFAGAVIGDSPFFYKFFVSDLTDLQPSRILGLNLDHRPAPNLFGLLQSGKPFDDRYGTAVAQMRQEELAARIDAEYVWPLVRGRRKFVKGADAFFLLGLYALADPRDLQVAMPGYEGASRIPVDLTFDLGVRLDTQIGVFQIGLAKLFWLPQK